MKKIGFIAGVSFLVGALFFALTFGYLHKTENNKPIISQDITFAETTKTNMINFAPLVKKVRPAVVKVLSESIIETRGSPFGDDLFDRFFSIPKRKRKATGIGSGFIISKDGYIITNNHVVKNAIKVKIVTLDKMELIAKIIGTDPKTDLALLKVKANNLPFIKLGDSNKVEVGEWVLAIGNPFGQSLTVTSGIVSAKGRQLGLAEYEDFIQTDAAINRGNSGGPLVNMEGKVIGITSAIIAPMGGNVGIGFAIPSNMAKKVINDLKTKGRVVRGWLGISIQELSKSDAKEYDLPEAGIIISSVEEGSPAKRAGLKKLDFITKINGERVTTGDELKTKIADSNPGTIIELTIYRGTNKEKIKVKIGEAPDTLKFKAKGEDGRSFDLGMILVKNNRSLSREYELNTSKGVLVKKVERGSIALQHGIKAGDVILGINRIVINSVDDFRRAISKKEPGSNVFLYINRYGNEFIRKFTLPEWFFTKQFLQEMIFSRLM